MNCRRRRSFARVELGRLHYNDKNDIFEKLSAIENVGKLRFPDKLDNFYDFKLEYFGEKQLLSNSRHEVSEYLHIPSKNICVIKKVPIPYNREDDEQTKQNAIKVLREISTHQKLAFSPYIVDFYGLAIHEARALICMEAMTTSLTRLYKEAHRSMEIIPEKLIGLVAVSITNALNFCKQNRVIHRDVKPCNILINKKGEIKLCDFGESRFMDTKYVRSQTGTVAYLAPERLNSNSDTSGYDDRAEVWSMGISLAEIIYGKLPYLKVDEAPNDYNIYNRITNLSHNDLNHIYTENYSLKLRDFISSCVLPKNQRPNVSKLQTKEFYKLYEKPEPRFIIRILSILGISNYSINTSIACYEHVNSITIHGLQIGFYSSATVTTRSSCKTMKNETHNLILQVSKTASIIIGLVFGFIVGVFSGCIIGRTFGILFGCFGQNMSNIGSAVGLLYCLIFYCIKGLQVGASVGEEIIHRRKVGWNNILNQIWHDLLDR